MLISNKKVAFATRSMSPDLFDLCKNLVSNLGLEHYKLENTEADEYLYKLLSLDADVIINIDEDAFVTNPRRLVEHVEFMIQEKYVCSGMPDGGVCPHRFHNPLVQNAFFNVIDIEEIRKDFSIIEAKPLTHKKEYEEYLPINLINKIHNNKFIFDNFEPYYPFFFWLLKHKKKMLYLDALEWNRDETSTVLLDQNGKPFMIHCWYSRAFFEHPDRFIMTAKFAEQIQQRVAV